MLALRKPSPDFETFKKVLIGKIEPLKVHLVELGIDYEVVSFLYKQLTGKEFPSREKADAEKVKLFKEGKDVPALLDAEKPYWESLIDFYYRMGYDYAPVGLPNAPFSVKSRVTEDTAILSRGKRSWVEEKEGVITSWDELESFPWDRINLKLQYLFRFVNQSLPAGMKITVSSNLGLYEMVGERLLGWEGLFKNLYLNVDLVKEVFNRWGEIVYNDYEEAVSHDCVGAIFHGDDLGYKKGTMIKPDVLREIVFPWFKKYASAVATFQLF
jgi:uroporphyrinogen decarboxylase